MKRFTHLLGRTSLIAVLVLCVTPVDAFARHRGGCNWHGGRNCAAAPPPEAAPPPAEAPPPLTSAAADDLYLLSTSVSPNVVVLLDTSGSMSHLEWHPAFDPEAESYGCSYFSSQSRWYAWQFDSFETECGRTRKIYKPTGSDTWYDGRYLNWYFSSAADPYINEIDTTVAPSSTCLQGLGIPSGIDQQYRRTRFQAAQQVALDLVCFAEPKGIRIGFARFRRSGEPHGGYVGVDVIRADPASGAALKTWLTLQSPGGA
ncbi:MAG: hypothetical protein QMC73_11485, partial [Myxococcota bacterium]